MSLEAVVAPKGSLEWKDILRAIGVVIRDETGELFDGTGKSLLCKECNKKLTMDNIGFVHKNGFYCAPLCSMIAMFDNEHEVDENTKVLELELDTLTECNKPEPDPVMFRDWFFEV
jgi:hypothetical protein